MTRIHCTIKEGGSFSESFKMGSGWQQEVRGWVAAIRNRFGIAAGSTLEIWKATDGVTFRYARSMNI